MIEKKNNTHTHIHRKVYDTYTLYVTKIRNKWVQITWYEKQNQEAAVKDEAPEQGTAIQEQEYSIGMIVVNEFDFVCGTSEGKWKMKFDA